MGRIRCVAPSLSVVRARLAPLRDLDGHSAAAEPWRKWYALARWKRLRLKIFERDAYTCQMPSCGRLEGNTANLVADHKQRHLGDPSLFWSETNLQTLCKPCHDRDKQIEDRRRPT
jgi:5-methylcytosine-specific restriction enzyme A